MGLTQSVTRLVRVKPDTTVGELKSWMASIPDRATVSVSISKGDRPFDSGETRITAQWSEEVKTDG